ncbi:MAG: hypothetical protein OHK0017_10930 [Patescibacteria group bacterium]
MSDLFSNPNYEEEQNQIISKPILQSALDGFLNPDSPAKQLNSEIDWVNTQRKTEYLLKVQQLLGHKSVSVRRAVVKTLENIGNKGILPDLKKQLETESDRQTLILLQNTIDRIERENGELAKSRDVYQVAEFLQTIKILIGSKSFVIEGEVSEVNIYHQVVYFSLKDKDSEERLDCLAYYSILNRLDFTLNNGLSVRITGKAGLSKGSRLRVQVTFIQLTGEGEFLRNLKLLQAKLEKEGLFDPERKRRLAILPKKIILMVSRGSAAETDFLKILNERRQGLEICIVPIKTQGDAALQILYSALQFVQSELETPGSYLADAQAIVITRGGGSSDDLNVFNQEQIVRAIHGLKVPTVVAIGHEKDWSLAEMAADFRASTPTQAAIAVSWSAIETKTNSDAYLIQIKQWIDKKRENYILFTDRVHQLIGRNLQKKINEIDQLLQKQDTLTNNFIHSLFREVNSVWQFISHLLQKRVTSYENNLMVSRSLSSYLKFSLENNFSAVNQAWKAIERAMKLKYDSIQKEVDFLNKNIAAYDTKLVLKRGFAVITDPKTGQAVERWSQYNSTDIKITLQDGDRKASINSEDTI